MQFRIEKAELRQAKLRLGLIGPSGSGKTLSALRIAAGIVEVTGGQIAVIDAENRSAAKYVKMVPFREVQVPDFAPQTYSAAIPFAAGEIGENGVLIADTISHAWAGKGGALEQKDQATAREQGNSWAAWRHVTVHHNAMVDAMIQCPCHLIATMRSKTEWAVEEYTDGNGHKKSRPRRIGTAPIQRDGIEYEFDVVADLDMEHNLIVAKTRCFDLDGLVVNKPGEELGARLMAWLDQGEPMISQDEVKAIQDAMKALNFKGRDMREALQPYGVERIEHLTAAQGTALAQTLVTGLEGQVEPDEPTPAEGQPAAMEDAIHAARTALGWDDDDMRDYVAEMYPESEPKALTTEQLETMLDDLNRMADMKQADQEAQEEVAKS